MFIKINLEKIYIFLFGMLGALTAFFLVYLMSSSPKNIETVNITGLVNQFIQQESLKNLPQDAVKQETKIFGDKLERELKRLAKQKNVVLLPSEAVIAGSHDETSLIKSRLMDENQDAK